MKRAILVVICDFLILSALSLATGVKEDNGQGFTPPGAALRVANPGNRKPKQQFDQKSIELFLKNKSIKKLSQDLGQKNKDIQKKKQQISKLANARKKLEQEKKTLQKNIASNKSEIGTLKKQNEEQRGKNLALKNENLKAKKDITKLHSDLTAKMNKLKLLADEKHELSEKSKSLSASLNETSTKYDKLMGLSKRLRTANLKLYDRVSKKKDDLKKLADISKKLLAEKENLMKKINDSEVELAKAKIQNKELSNKTDILSQEVKLKENHIESLKKNNQIVIEGYVNLRKVINDKEDNIKFLKEHLDDVKDEKEDLKETIIAKKTEIKELRKKLKGTGFIWEKYHKLAREVNIYIRERSPFIDNIYKNKYYLPLIELNGKIMLAGEFNSIGLGWSKIYSGQISALDIKVIADRQKKNFVKVKDPILSLNTQPKVCFVQIPYSDDLKAFKPIGLERLRKRGLDGIFLFKLDGSSREVQTSFIGQGGNTYLRVNEIALKGGELKSEEGDFLFTKQGEYIGVLLSEKKAFIQPLTVEFSDFTRIPVNKSKKNRLYKIFAHKVKMITDRIK